MSEEHKYFELIFQGPVDDSAKTLQRLKGTFVADLEFPVDEVQRFLSEAPLTIMQSESEAAVNSIYQKLQAAGARVLLVRPQATDLPPKETPPEDAVDLELAFSEPSSDDAENKPESEVVESSSNNLQLDIDDLLFNTTTETAAPGADNAQGNKPEPDSEKLFPNLAPPTAEEKLALTESPRSDTSTPTADLSLLDGLDDSLEQPVLPPATTVREPEVKPSGPTPSKVLSPASEPTFSLELDEAPTATPSGAKSEHSTKSPSLSTATSAATVAATKSEFDLTLESVVEEPKLIEPNYEEPIESIPPPIVEEEEDLSVKAVDAPQPTIESGTGQKSTMPAAAPATATEPAREETLRERMQRRAQEATTAASEAPPVEEVEEEIDPAATRRARKKFIVREVLPLAGVCAVLLALGNILYFMLFAGPSDETKNFEKQISMVLDSLPKRSSFEAVKPAPVIPLIELKYSSEHDGRNFWLTFETRGEEIVAVQGQLITPPPPALSPEEIVRGVARAPWLYNLEINNIEFTKGENNTLRGIGSTKSYIEYKGNRARISGTVTIAMTLQAQAKTAKGEVTFFAGMNSADNLPEENTSVPNPGRFRYVYRETFEITPPVVENSAPAPSAESATNSTNLSQ